MNQLIKRVLAVRARFAPEDRAGIVGHLLAVHGHVLSIALHGQLLQVGREPFQILFVRQHRYGLGVEKVTVPHHQQTHEPRQILFQRRRAEMLVHFMESAEHRAKILRPDCQHRRKSDR